MREGTWLACYCRGSFQGVDQGTAHLMVGSSAGVEVVTIKVTRKIFPTVMRYSDSGGTLPKPTSNLLWL